MTKHKGKYVLCYQKFENEGLTDTPFEIKILGETRTHWFTEGALGETLKPHKGACSTKPYSKD